MRWFCAGFVALVGLLGGPGNASFGGEPTTAQLVTLRKLVCVRLAVEIKSDAQDIVTKSIGLTGENLRDIVLAAVKTKLPGLEVSENCTPGPGTLALAGPPDIRLVVSAVKSILCATYLRFSIRRGVSFQDSGHVFLAPVWSSGNLAMGRCSRHKPLVIEAIDELVAQFAVDYTKAQNPQGAPEAP